MVLLSLCDVDHVGVFCVCAFYNVSAAASNIDRKCVKRKMIVKNLDFDTLCNVCMHMRMRQRV